MNCSFSNLLKNFFIVIATFFLSRVIPYNDIQKLFFYLNTYKEVKIFWTILVRESFSKTDRMISFGVIVV